MSLSISLGPDEITPQQEWREKWNVVKKLAEDLWEEAEKLMIKGRIPSEDKEEPNFIEWTEFLVTIFEKRIGKDREKMRKTIAFHPFIGSTMHYSDRYPFDLAPNNAIQSCARILLLELREANKEQSTAEIKF